MPHWPNGSEAEESPDGKYIVNSDDLIIGFETNPVTMTIDEARKIYPNEINRLVTDSIMDDAFKPSPFFRFTRPAEE